MLENRGLKTKKKKFLTPDLLDLTIENAKIDRKEVGKSIERINKAIKKESRLLFLEIMMTEFVEVQFLGNIKLFWELKSCLTFLQN